MEAALEDCEKSSGGNNEKAKLFYDYGVWNFNSIALPNRFATAKKAYARCVALTDSNDRKAMALEMMADCDYFAGTAAADSEKNGEQAWKYRHEPGGNQDPAALWGTVEAMGRAYMVCGHYDKAAAAFKQAMDMAEKNNLWKGDAAPQSAGDLACAYALQGDRQSGDKTFFDSIERYDKLIGACSEPAERVIAAYARALMKTGDQESAAKLVSRLDDPDSLNNIGPFFKAFFI
jgi:tetratricopeptide (TPR) repeat protein